MGLMQRDATPECQSYCIRQDKILVSKEYGVAVTAGFVTADTNLTAYRRPTIIIPDNILHNILSEFVQFFNCDLV